MSLRCADDNPHGSTTRLTPSEELQSNPTIDATLAVGDDTTLTLGTDALIVVDDALRVPGRGARTCFGLLSHTSVSSQSIPYYHILSGTVADKCLQIQYAGPVSTKKTARLQVRTLSYTISPDGNHAVQKWLARLMQVAYGMAQFSRRVKVLINPYGGAGRALSIYQTLCQSIFEAANCSLDVETTRYRGHATEIARDLDMTQYDVIVCASGDGLPMEVFNGLAQKPNAATALKKVAVVQLPCGTGNAMSLNLNGTSEPSQAALAIIKGVRAPLDLASVTQNGPDGITRTLSFLSQSLGIVAESDLGTDNIRWMGDFRFTYGFLVRLLGKTVYPVEYAVKTEIEDKLEIKRHYAREMKRQHDPAPDLTANKTEADDDHQGLPPLQYGTINDPLTATATDTTGWSKLTPYPNLGNFYLGNMCYMAADAPFFPASLPHDGMMDLVTIDGDISRWKALQLLLSVQHGHFFDHPLVRMRKISAVRVYPRYGQARARLAQPDTELDATLGKSTLSQPVTFWRRALQKLGGSGSVSGSSRNKNKPLKDGCFAVDGEKLPFEPFQVEVHPGLGTVLAKRVGRYEYAEGPKGWSEVGLERDG